MFNPWIRECEKCKGRGYIYIPNPVAVWLKAEHGIEDYTVDCQHCGGKGGWPTDELQEIVEALDRFGCLPGKE